MPISHSVGTWCARKIQSARARVAKTVARRRVPRRSPRPSLKLRRVRKNPPTRSVTSTIASSQLAAFSPTVTTRSAERLAGLHGPMVSTLTSRPPYAAASTRNGISGARGRRTFHAATESAKGRGFRRGSTAVHPAGSNRPSDMRSPQSGDTLSDLIASSDLTCGGTASKPTRRPSVSSTTRTSPENSSGGLSKSSRDVRPGAYSTERAD